jgi:hypothetical protein
MMTPLIELRPPTAPTHIDPDRDRLMVSRRRAAASDFKKEEDSPQSHEGNKKAVGLFPLPVFLASFVSLW